MLHKIINNFYLKNLAVLLAFISPDVLQRLAMHNRINIVDIRQVLSLSAFFMYFIFHNRVLYENLALKRKYFLYAIVFLSTLFAWRESTSYLIWLLTKSPDETVYTIRELREYNFAFWFFIYWADVIYIYIALGIYLSFKYFNERTRLLLVENARKELELKQLNEQLNPHFLFNALNNIYSHLLRNSSNGRELILKLGELMRHILDNSKKNTVPLEEELSFIENYLAFENERLGERCITDYRKEIKTGHFNIVPLILFNFIENAFKHGTASIQQSEIAINIYADNTSLRLFVSNTKSDQASISTKTGLDNTIRRLALLYDGRYSLDIDSTGEKYSISLEVRNIL